MIYLDRLRELQKNRNAFIFTGAVIPVILLIILLKVGLFGNWQMMLEDKMYVERPPLDNIVIIAIDDKSLSSLGPFPWNRSVYVDMVNHIGNASVIGFDIGFFNVTDDDWEFSKALYGKNVVFASEYTSFWHNDSRLYGNGLIYPSYRLLSGNVSVGYANIIRDKDDAVRRIPRVESGINSFSGQVALAFKKSSFAMPSDDLIVNFGGPPGRFRTVSFIDVNGTDPSFFSNKIVLVGATSSTFNDSHVTPTSRGLGMPGVEVHANALETMLIPNAYLMEQSDLSIMLSMVIIAIIMAAIFSMLRSRGTLSSILPFLFIPIYWFIFWFAAVFASWSGYIMNLFYPPLAIVFSSLGIAIGNYFYEGTKRTEVLNEFGRYVSPDVVNAIFKGEKKIELTGVEKEISVIFADIRGFTTLSERLKPPQLVGLLNAYLGRLAMIVFDNDGTVDKYMGDAIMAVYNSPFDVESHEYKACLSALQMQDAIRLMNEENKKTFTGFPDLRMGIGINSGKAIIGNIGSKERVDFTAIGDTVNITSRIEALTKDYGVYVIIGENIYDKVKGRFFIRELDYVRVKGKSRPVRIFELRRDDYDKRWDEALRLYRDGDFRRAKALFRAVGDEASAVFIERCDNLIAMKISKEKWDGVFTYTTK
jgi:adenylate cyclase